MPQKNRLASVLLLPGLLMLASACSRSPTSDDTAAVRSDVEQATEALHQALRTNDADALFTHVADDVVMFPPGEAPVRGKAAMQAWYSGFLSQVRTTSLTLSDREVFVGNGWASEIGQFEWVLEPVAGGDPIIDRGSYLQIWKLHPDGRWLFSREIWNSSVPPPVNAGS